MFTEEFYQHFLESHKLPESYRSIAARWFEPLAASLAHRKQAMSSPLVVGIHGCQGSGKSTLADFLSRAFTQIYGLRSLSVSLDDFYLTRAERRRLAESVHPLFQTRGVPGTHDVSLAISTLNRLLRHKGICKVPHFDKARDDRAMESHWVEFEGPADIVVFEGWCFGAGAQDEEALEEPVNSFERNRDKNRVWRKFANDALQSEYQSLFAMAKVLVMLKAPSFKCVYDWRVEQEEKMKIKLLEQGSPDAALTGAGVMTPEQIQSFIQHYQRLTEHCLQTLPGRADYVFHLDAKRAIQKEVDGRGFSRTNISSASIVSEISER